MNEREMLLRLSFGTLVYRTSRSWLYLETPVPFELHVNGRNKKSLACSLKNRRGRLGANTEDPGTHWHPLAHESCAAQR
jgi:hypothetical protein